MLRVDAEPPEERRGTVEDAVVGCPTRANRLTDTPLDDQGDVMIAQCSVIVALGSSYQVGQAAAARIPSPSFSSRTQSS
ncbi:MAG: hypothetical protein ACRDTT_10325 [Pseudonocardiaceae bacterium]